MSKQTGVDLSIIMRELEMVQKKMASFEEGLGKIGNDTSILRIKVDQVQADVNGIVKPKVDTISDNRSAETEETLTQDEIAKELIEANIMQPSELKTSSSLLKAVERQVKQKGNETFLEVVSNVSARIKQGGVKNRLGYFRTSMNEAMGR